MKSNRLKLMAVLSTAAVMAAVTPELSSQIPGNVSTAYAAVTGWVDEAGELRFLDGDGYYLTDSWKKKDGEWYYLNEEGYVTRSSVVDEYYVDENGKRIFDQWIGIANEDDAWDDDAPETFWYYFGKDGRYAASKWQAVEGKWYYFNDEGHMQTGKLEVNGYTYYLGEEGDGVRKTGWVQLVNESDDYEEDMVWHYFDNEGRMIMNQIDRKIGGEYYTFINGVLQTGWVQIPKTVDETAATDSNAQPVAPTIASYQYYEESGKRADGWYEIEGVSGISSEDETYKFFFKNGKPYHAAAGIETFTINSKKYGFNTKGEMQTELQVVTNEDGTTSNFYFGDDGVMRTGKQTIYNENLDENQTWLFHTDGGNKGRGVHGVKDNCVYNQGLRQDADRDLRYAPVELDGTQYLVNASGTIQKSSSSSKSSAMPELGNGFKDIKDANDKVWTVDTNGIVQK